MSQKTYQKRKMIRDRITNGLIFGGLFFVGLLFLISSIRSILVWKNLNDNELLYYRGNCVVTQKHFLRNTTYVFALENGDVVSVPSEHLRSHDMLQNKSNLSLVYVGPRAINGYGIIGSYTGVSISTLDDGLSFLDSQSVGQDIKSGVFVYLIISVVSLSVSLGGLYFFLFKQ